MVRASESSAAERLLDWHAHAGRHDLPWQKPRSAYRVWVSEIMLQQTQVATVIPYFERFMQLFPDVQALADADADEVMSAWAGLGYYSRARNLHRAARQIRDEHGGSFPSDFESVLALPGIGRSTAGAILAQSFGERHAILDGNVKRVLTRHEAIAGWPGKPAVEKTLWKIAEAWTPRTQLADYSQAIMDLGATLCRRSKPQCGLCPLSGDCKSLAAGRVADFPEPRPRKTRPLRRVRMLMLERAPNEVLLIRRPPSGIWGGLWCLPEVPEDVAVREYCRQSLGIDAGGFEEVGGLRHGFTHFELDIHPMRGRAAAVSQISDDGDRRWYTLAAENSLDQMPGMPAPVVRLLAQEFGIGNE